jgi:hypothetical protein
METLTEAIDRLRGEGYRHDFSAVPGAKLRCGACGSEIAASELTITEVVRFEGESDPGDESVLYGLSGSCGHAGLYSAAFGSDATAEDIAVIAALGQ